MVVMTSTNGTWLTTALKRSRRMFTTAPMRRPPALPPWITRRSGAVKRRRTSDSAAAMKSVKVFFLRWSLPSSYQ